jgi:4-amino-4-deoxy-L-arabinose transferase-like glycosyltransferase
VQLRPKLHRTTHPRIDGTTQAELQDRQAVGSSITVVAVLAAGFILRLLFLATPDLDSDQAIFGLMAMHILRGELPLFQWGYNYMGTLESFVAAPLMLVFGPTRFALNLAPTLFSLLFAYAVYLFAREAAGHRAGVWALAFACFPPCFLVWNVVVARGGYAETLALGTLASYFAFKATADGDPRAQRRALIACGFSLGLGFWTHLNIAVYAAAILAFWLIERPALVRVALRFASAPFLVGSLPLWIRSVEERFKTFSFATPPLPALSARVWTLVSYRLPVVLGVYFDNSTKLTIPYLAWLLVPIQLSSLWVLWRLSRAAPSNPLRRGARLLLLLGSVFLLLYFASPFSGVNTQRYLIPLYTVITVAPALVAHELARSRRLPALLFGFTVLALYAIPTIGSARLLDAQALRAYRQARGQEKRLLATIEQLGLHAVYADDYWDTDRFTFDASERVIFAHPFRDRVAQYLDFVDGAERPAFLFHYPPRAAPFEGTLKLAGARYRKRVIEGFQLYSDIAAPPSGGPEIPVVTASASDNAIDAPLAVDHDAATRWEAAGRRRQETWFKVDLGREQEVAEVDLWPRFYPEEPRGLRVEASLDGENWRSVAAAKDYWRNCSWAENRPLPNLDGWVVARFEPIRCRWIRLTDVGEHRAYYWAIDELKVRAPPDWIPHVSEAPPTVTAHLFADPVLAARWPRAVKHQEGEALPRFRDLRDASMIGRDDSIVVSREDPLVVQHGDARIGARYASATSLGDFVLLRGLRLETEDLERRAPSHWEYDAKNETASVDLGATAEVSGVVVEHRDAASSFPRGLLARTSTDGERWSDPEPLTARPPALFWSDEGLLGASLNARVFIFAEPRPIRFLELSASPRQPTFPWVLRSVTVLVPHGDRPSNPSG